MPMLFALGQHPALVAAVRRLHAGERLFAYLDDVYVVTTPDRVGAVFTILSEELRRYSRIRIHGGKTQVWNAAGIRPPACDELDRVAQAEDPEAPSVWRGGDLPLALQGIKVLGTPLGQDEFIEAHLARTSQSHETLLDRIPMLSDVQSAWALLLHCANARATYLLRVVRPEMVQRFADGHDRGLWRCLSTILGVHPEQCDLAAKEVATLPLTWRGLGLRSAVRTSVSAYWASWADSLAMIHQRHPEVADRIVVALDGVNHTPALSAARSAGGQLMGVEGFNPPSWRALSLGARPAMREPDDFEPGTAGHGWQHEASSRVEREHRERWIMPRLADSEKAMLRSQSGPGAGLALSATPSNYSCRIAPHLFRVLLLRLRLPLPLVSRTCRCGRPTDVLGHHRAACARAGVLGRRGFALESAAARVCREGGARVSTNVMVRDLDLRAPDVLDGRRLEVVAEGLPLFGGAQLALDTTLVSALHCDGSARPHAANVDGVALVAARRRKELTCPELVGPRSRARLVVLAGEVGGRWSAETMSFLGLLAKARARSETPLLRRRVEQAWRIRWGSMLACAAARAFAASLLDQRAPVGSDGNTPASHEVVADYRYAGLG